MKYEYTLITNNNNVSVVVRSDGASIPLDPTNSDYQAYLRWLENPEAEQSTPSVIDEAETK